MASDTEATAATPYSTGETMGEPVDRLYYGTIISVLHIATLLIIIKSALWAFQLEVLLAIRIHTCLIVGKDLSTS